MEPDNTKSPYAGLASKIRDGKSASTQEFESRPPELFIKRGYDGSAGHGIRGKILMAYRNLVAASSFRVLVDDIEVGYLDQNEQLKVQVAPGSRRIKIVSSLASSNTIAHVFANGDRLTLCCRTKLFGIVLFK